MDKLKKILSWLLFFFVIAIFIYFRLKPIINQTVPYTFDQGRDFLKAAEIVTYKNPTFIGPTTGIAGLYHGAWYYYYLAVPFLIFGGLPIGFYYFHFLVYLGSFIFLYYFFSKYLGEQIAVLISFFVASSPYFIGISFFIGNNNVAPPLVLFFLALNYLLFKEKPKNEPLLFFLTGFTLGHIAEAEFAFGLMLIPVYLLLTFVFKKLRRIYSKLPNFLFFYFGLVLPFSLRLLFEVKNNFLQIRTLLSFIVKPKFYTSKPYKDILIDRVNLFWGYYKGLFDHQILAYGFLALVAVSLFLIIRKKRRDSFLIFLATLLGSLFLFSTFYKDTFWANYYEGIQYIFIFLIVLLLKLSTQLTKKINLGLFSLAILIVGFMVSFYNSLKPSPKIESLANQQEIVSHVVKNNINQDYCLKIYTPPVIPYTYDYLSFYNNYKGISKQSQKDWVNDACWFIVERDDFAFRRDEWLAKNLPSNGKKEHEKKFLDTLVFFYHR